MGSIMPKKLTISLVKMDEWLHEAYGFLITNCYRRKKLEQLSSNMKDSHWSEEDIQNALKTYKFYHIIQLREGLSTPGALGYVPAQELCMKHVKSLDLKEKRRT